jgi:predicted ATP-dependent protease
VRGAQRAARVQEALPAHFAQLVELVAGSGGALLEAADEVAHAHALVAAAQRDAELVTKCAAQWLCFRALLLEILLPIQKQQRARQAA